VKGDQTDASHQRQLETGNLKGADHGATISLILDNSEPGHGPRLHRHPYDETWIVQEGHLTFQLADERVAVGPAARETHRSPCHAQRKCRARRAHRTMNGRA
jgi:quercetin dioxygenase-like cupin family protein